MAENITSIATLITALSLIISAYLSWRRDRRIEKAVDYANIIGNENHKMLNQERTDAANYRKALIRALESRGIEIPIDQSGSETTL